MTELFGQKLSKLELEKRTGSLMAFAGVRLVTLGDGLERGIRALEFRSGSGLRFNVLIDRAFDIGDCEFKGQAIAWHSPTGFRNPALHEYEGEGGLGWTRSFSGLMVTGGLDHILFMSDESASHFNYGPKEKIKSSLHGRISNIPGKLESYGEMWNGEKCIFYCQGTVIQAAVFGEDLHLNRRIEIELGSNEIHVIDNVINHGFSPTPHMFLYHINLGFPLLDSCSEYLAPIKSSNWASHSGQDYEKQGIGYSDIPEPVTNFHEQVWEHEMVPNSHGRIVTAVINPKLNLGFAVNVSAKEFPAQFEWQNYREGNYAIGIEPSTNHVLGEPFAKERGELIWLKHGESRKYHSTFKILDSAEGISQLRDEIRSTQIQPAAKYPEVTNVFGKISHE